MKCTVVLFSFTLAFFNCWVACNNNEKSISAIVYTKWSETPLVLEASEFLYKNNPQAFWKFVRDVSVENRRLSEIETDQSQYETLIAICSAYLTPLELDLLRLSLSMRAFSPTVEATRKMADDTNSECLTFVDIHGQISCDLNKIESLLFSADLSKRPFVHKSDKHHPLTSNNGNLVVLLYANIVTKEFADFNDRILELYQSSRTGFDYILRYNTRRNGQRVALSGYGVELDIKSTEYKAKDDTKVNADEANGVKKNLRENEDDESIQGFVFSKLKALNPDMEKQLNEFRGYLLESTRELPTLKGWQIQDISVQAAQSILEMEKSQQLSTLLDLSQNFPLRARALSKIKLKKDIKQAMQMQRRHFESVSNMESGNGALYVNGVELNVDSIDIFTLNAQLMKEAKLIESLHKTGFDLDRTNSLIKLDMSSKSLEYGIDIRDTSVQWVNDLEADKKYQYWSKSLQDIMRPTYPGMMRSIARNIFNLVLIVDPVDESSKTLIKTIESFYVNDMPIRIGLVLVANKNDQTDGFVDASVAIYRAHNYVKEKSNAPKALSFLTDLYAVLKDNEKLTAEFVINQFKRVFPREKSIDDVFGVDSDYDDGRKLSMEFYNKNGNKLPQVLLNGIPFNEKDLEANAFEETVVNKIMKVTSDIQMAYYNGQLNEHHNVVDWLMGKDVIMPRLNQRILSATKEFVNMNDFDADADAFVNNLKYLKQSGLDKFHSLTIWAVCDPDTEQGRVFLSNAVEFFDSNQNTRLGILFQSSGQNSLIKKAILYALDNLNGDEAIGFIRKIIKENIFDELIKSTKTFDQIEVKNLIADRLDEHIRNYDVANTLSKHENFIQTYLKFDSKIDIGVVANGWILGPLSSNEAFITSDFQLLYNFLSRTGLSQLADLFRKWPKNAVQNNDDLILKANAILGKYSSDEKRVSVNLPNSASHVHIKPKHETQPFFDIIAILDPLTRYSQRLSQILTTLVDATNVNLRIYFNCKDKHSGLPLKSFYRYVFESDVRFNDDGYQQPLAYFHNMPQSPLLTMNMHPPESWMVEAVRAPYDLDNIFLEEIDTASGAHGEYELEHMIIEGHCYDLINGQPPRGLQFNSGTQSNPNAYDTIVMANLGYFQLKASPGSWIVQLREGRSSDIYEIVGHENTDSPSTKAPQVTVVIDSFESKIIKIKVTKRPGKQNDDILADIQDDGSDDGIWGSIKNSFGGADKAVASADDGNVLNIFSVASGHLYERFLRIMMLTVLKNTKARVKFWFLKNYLSPQFTKFLPAYAKAYDFDYELVQYKWPRWLHHETEKQRIIWAYKILFLDVLFPLSVKKIIFVDADQIVRADLTELRDLDLKGAPYGYTPFCDSRKDMEGYRFWKTGYWAMHLGHRKYHISALYVIDLKKFRKIAAGDRLRGQYQGLSQDPNSLSNLDQDLPNNMIHQVNIFSLPQEWLYCDTWCSNDTLKNAKTIDLCNNPNTKEPKLQAAVRIVPEWKDYDNEIKGLMDKWQQQMKQQQQQAKTEHGHSEL